MFAQNPKVTDIFQRDLSSGLFRKSAAPRILVADDDPITARLLTTIGEREGYQVVSVNNGRDAYRMLKSNADFAAAIFNMTMPNLGGADLIRHMKTEKRLMRIPVVIVAGDDGLKLIADTFAAGALAFLPKPFTTEKLAQIVRLVLSQTTRRKTNEGLGKVAA